MSLSKVIVVCTLFAFLPKSYAGKVEDVQAAMKSECSKDVSSADALKLVKVLFMSCTPGDTVDADGCKVKCLKTNDGAVVGK